MHRLTCVLLVGLLAVGILTVGGCGGVEPPANLPKLYGAVGTVNRPGGEAITGGTVQFQSVDQPEHVALAEIQPDGSFKLQTIVDGNKFTGAVEGPQRVTFLPMNSQSPTAEQPHTFTELFVIKPEQNQFTITIPALK